MPRAPMKITDFIQEDLIIAELQSSSAADVIAELAAFMAERHKGVDPQALARALMQREEGGSTAIGEGVAIPHAKLDSSGKLIACLGRSRRGVDFGSPDGKRTMVFFALVVPEKSAGVHLKALARISRLAMDPGFRAALLDAETTGAMHKVLADADAKR